MPFSLRASRPTVRSTALMTLLAAALLSACGGGGADAGTPPFGNEGSNPSGSGLQASSSLAQQCAADNSLAPAARRTATLDTERRWVRSYMDEAYLWYREIPSVNTADPNFNLASVTDSLDNYFQALKSRQRTASGKLRDEFSFTYPTLAWEQLSGRASSPVSVPNGSRAIRRRRRARLEWPTWTRARPRRPQPSHAA